MKTLQQYLEQNVAHGVIDFDLRANVDADTGEVTFYIHPEGKDGETLDWVTEGNQVRSRWCP